LKLPVKALAFALALVAVPGAAQDAPPAAAAAMDPAQLALAGEVIDLAYPPAMRHAMMMGAVDTMMEQARTATVSAASTPPDPDLTRILDRYLDRARAIADDSTRAATPAIFAAFARAYARHFTHDELVQIRAFVATPAGARFVQRSSGLMTDPDVARANTAYMATVFAALEPLRQELQREVIDHLRSHPQSPASAGPDGPS
jgi:hypothetical protein